MYDKEAIRQRFLEEVERLVNEGVAPSIAQVVKGCGLESYHISAIKKRQEVTISVLVPFVTTYHKKGVSYGYILEGKREKPAPPHKAISLIEQAQAQLQQSVQLLTA